LRKRKPYSAFSSHDLHQVQQVCDRVGLFVSGKLIAEGDIQTLSKKLFANSPYIIEAGITQNAISIDGNSGIEYNTEWLKKGSSEC